MSWSICVQEQFYDKEARPPHYEQQGGPQAPGHYDQQGGPPPSPDYYGGVSPNRMDEIYLANHGQAYNEFQKWVIRHFFWFKY